MQLNDCDFRDNTSLISLTTWIVLWIGILWDRWKKGKGYQYYVSFHLRFFRLIHIIRLFTSICNLRSSFATIGSSIIFNTFAWTSFERTNQLENSQQFVFNIFVKMSYFAITFMCGEYFKTVWIETNFFINSFEWLY